MLQARTPMMAWLQILMMSGVLWHPAVALSKTCPLLAEVVDTPEFRQSHEHDLRTLRKKLDSWAKQRGYQSNGYLQQLRYMDDLELLLTFNFIAALHYQSFNPTVAINAIREVWRTALYRRHFLLRLPKSQSQGRRVEHGINLSVPQGVPVQPRMAFDFVVIFLEGKKLYIDQVGEIKSGNHSGAMQQVHKMLFAVQQHGIQIHRRFFPPRNIFLKNPRGKWVPIHRIKRVTETIQKIRVDRMDSGTPVILLRSLSKREKPLEKWIEKTVQLPDEDGLTIFQYRPPQPNFIRVVFRDAGNFDQAITALRAFFRGDSFVRALVDRLAVDYEPSFHPQSFRFPNGHGR